MSKDSKLPIESDNHVVGIASFDGLDKSLREVLADALSERGIRYWMEGSVLYGVLVYRKDAESAVEVLTHDKRLAGKKVRIFQKPQRINIAPDTTP